MSDRCTEEGAASAGSLVASTRSRLEPFLVSVTDALTDDGDTRSSFAAREFVQNLLERLQSLDSETELLHLLLDISLIGFQGFDLSDSGKRAIDTLLVECESIAQTLAAANRSN